MLVCETLNVVSNLITGMNEIYDKQVQKCDEVKTVADFVCFNTDFRAELRFPYSLTVNEQMNRPTISIISHRTK